MYDSDRCVLPNVLMRFIGEGRILGEVEDFNLS